MLLCLRRRCPARTNLAEDMAAVNMTQKRSTTAAAAMKAGTKLAMLREEGGRRAQQEAEGRAAVRQACVSASVWTLSLSACLKSGVSWSRRPGRRMRAVALAAVVVAAAAAIDAVVAVVAAGAAALWAALLPVGMALPRRRRSQWQRSFRESLWGFLQRRDLTARGKQSSALHLRLTGSSTEDQGAGASTTAIVNLRKLLPDRYRTAIASLQQKMRPIMWPLLRNKDDFGSAWCSSPVFSIVGCNAISAGDTFRLRSC